MIEEMWITRPQRRSFMPRHQRPRQRHATGEVQLDQAVPDLVVISSIGCGRLAPALLTRMSTLPSRRDGRLGQAADVAAVGHVGDEVFRADARLLGDLGGRGASSSSWRLERKTSAPAWAKIAAMALPNPRLPPVTRATRPERLKRFGNVHGTLDRDLGFGIKAEV